MIFKSLFKASMTEGMDVINMKKGGKGAKIAIGALVFLSFFSYANVILMSLRRFGSDEIALVSMFVALTAFMTLVEGIYKSGGLLFNCRDDDMLLSMPLSRAQIVGLRILKFYIFELVFNTLFLAPAILTYIIHANPGASFYFVSAVMILLTPVIPVAISSVIGAITSTFASRFKKHNIVQTVLTFAFMIALIAVSFNAGRVTENIGEIAGEINNTITRIYYPAKVYVDLVSHFDFGTLLIFIGIHIAIVLAAVAFIAKVYFRVSSRLKTVPTSTSRRGEITFVKKPRKPFFALIKKELNRFFSTPVFIVNAGFGLVLFLIAAVAISLKFDGIAASIESNEEVLITAETIRSYLPAGTFALIAISSFMTFITATMISLEGKALNLLKALPTSAKKIVLAKVGAALTVMLPPLLIGTLIMIFRFQFGIIESLLLIIAALVLPAISEMIGITVDLKHAKFNAESDTEVVKQSLSTMIATFVGLGAAAMSVSVIAVFVITLGQILGLLALDLVGITILLAMYLRLRAVCERRFKSLQV